MVASILCSTLAIPIRRHHELDAFASEGHCERHKRSGALTAGQAMSETLITAKCTRSQDQPTATSSPTPKATRPATRHALIERDTTGSIGTSSPSPSLRDETQVSRMHAIANWPTNIARAPDTAKRVNHTRRS